MKRREFLGQAAVGAFGLAGAPLMKSGPFRAPFLRNNKIAQKVIVLGIDGMDPKLLRRFVKSGDMPTFAKFMQRGHSSKLRTTLPPQSPVAWSSFITGSNPGGHGIFDFIHRDPAKFLPYLSTSRTFPSDDHYEIGKWSIPLEGDRLELLRKGPAFWTLLEDKDVSASLFKLPANFPVEQGKAKSISGMSTPDILGSYGTFTYFTDAYVPGAEGFTGGRVVEVEPIHHTVKTKLAGPRNELRVDKELTGVELEINRDPTEPVLRIKIEDHEIVLAQGEWSEWVPLKFEVVPMFSSISGMVRFYAQEVHPQLRLYATPINIDPMDPVLPICSPSGYSKELSEAVGRFYTQGFPEDTKALSHGIFSSDEFLSQSKLVLEERLKAFDYEFSNFKEGFFFFYFSSIDQNTHMMWRHMDPDHPLYEAKASDEVKNAVKYFYKSMDNVLKQVLSKIDNRTTLLVMSDHGFAPFKREFHLSTWLVENGYTAVTDPDLIHEGQFYQYVDWKRTKAYAMGLNGIYLNIRDREPNGSVSPDQAQRLKAEIISKLSEVRDHEGKAKAIAAAYDSSKVYSGPYLALAPDIIVGYSKGYRISDEAVLGKFPFGVFGDRIDKWSADHCMDPRIVPGVLLTNREVAAKNPGIGDLAPTILNEFGIKPPQSMDGKAIFA